MQLDLDGVLAMKLHQDPELLVKAKELSISCFISLISYMLLSSLNEQESPASSSSSLQFSQGAKLGCCHGHWMYHLDYTLLLRLGS